MIIRKWLYDSIVICIGSLAMALGIALFLLPNDIAAGGSPGVTVVIRFFVDLSPGMVLFTVNGGLMLLGLRTNGLPFLLRTLVATVLISVFTDIASSFVTVWIPTDNRLVAAVYSGVLLGLGIGLIFKADASPGGWGILIKLVAERTHIGVGQVAAIFDGSVVLAATFLFKDFEAGLLGGIGVFIVGRVVDWVLIEKPKTHLVNIHCEHAALLQDHIHEQFGIHGTLLRAKSHESSSTNDMLHLSVEWRDLTSLKRTIATWAPDAYVTVSSPVNVIDGTNS